MVTNVLDTTSLSNINPNVISDELCRRFQWAIFALTLQVVVAVGTSSNIVNVICFVKLGFKESIDVYFLDLAISDLGCLITLIFTNLCYTPAFQDLNLPFDPADLQYLASAWPHIIFVRVTGMITALITVERCLSITMPLKVRLLFTPKRSALAIMGLFAVSTLCVTPVFCANTYDWIYWHQRNKTILRLLYRDNHDILENIASTLSNVFLPVSSFFIVLVCTAALVIKLKDKTKWREQATHSEQAKSISYRDQKVARLVVAISGLFIVCYTPVFLMFAIVMCVPEVSLNGMNENLVVVVGGCGLIFEGTNSAMNCVIYYHMSSKYKSIFQKLFKIQK